LMLSVAMTAPPPGLGCYRENSPIGDLPGQSRAERPPAGTVARMFTHS